MLNFMRAIDRVHAERQLITVFDRDMTWADIDLFFKRLRVRKPKFDDEGSYTIKDLVRGYLADCSDDLLIDIAHQLHLDVASETPNPDLVLLGDSKYWLIDHFRIFISHVHTSKLQAGALRDTLQRYAISAFVAHEDIDTSDEWREEILRSLMSMDAFVAILSTDFNSSKWTDQEVGVAVARDVIMIPINRGENPYGFLAKYQALSSRGLKAKEVAAEIFRIVANNTRTKGRLIEALVRTITSGSDVSEIIFRIEKLSSIDGVGLDDWERIRENVAGNNLFRTSQRLQGHLNETLVAKGLAPIEFSGNKMPKPDDEIPF